MSRYIKKKVRNIVDKESGFKCAWCGIVLRERHHISEYAAGGDNSADNLILLCPNCHTDTHNGSISREDLEQRKKLLSGCVIRSSGNLPIKGSPIFILGGTKFEGGIERILVHDNKDYLKIQVINDNLYVSLQLFDKVGKLLCWMNKNRWWVEDEEIFNFKFGKGILEVESEIMDSILRIRVNSDFVSVTCKMFVEGRLIEFDENHFNLNNNFLGRIGTIVGNSTSIAFEV